MKTLENVYFKHFYCPKCEKKNIPTKNQAGITLHALQLLKTDSNSACLNVICLTCGAIQNKDNPKLMTIIEQRPIVLPIKEWNALMKFNKGNDGFVD